MTDTPPQCQTHPLPTSSHTAFRHQDFLSSRPYKTHNTASQHTPAAVALARAPLHTSARGTLLKSHPLLSHTRTHTVVSPGLSITTLTQPETLCQETDSLWKDPHPGTHSRTDSLGRCRVLTHLKTFYIVIQPQLPQIAEADHQQLAHSWSPATSPNLKTGDLFPSQMAKLRLRDRLRLWSWQLLNWDLDPQASDLSSPPPRQVETTQALDKLNTN